MFYEETYTPLCRTFAPKQQIPQQKYRKTIHKACVNRYIKHRVKLAYQRGLEDAMPRAIKMALRDESVKLIALKKQRLRLKMMQERDREISKQMFLTAAPTDAPIDLIGDIEWVYKNLGVLFVVAPSGAKMLNPEVLKLAPSSGAISFATYALENQMAFFDKFVSMLLRQQVSEDTKGAAVKEEKKIKAVDESLKELEQFLK